LTAQDILAEVAALPDRSIQAVRRLRRAQSRLLAGASGPDMLSLAKTILAAPEPLGRLIAYELVAHHPAALRALSARSVRALADRLGSWGDTDMFAYCIAGPAWRLGRLNDGDVLAWSRSPDRWWRRAALVATVPLNVRAQGGTGDARRTLRICQALVTVRDPMVVKALSWALRALVFHAREQVQEFLEANAGQLAALVRREVTSKLATGRKAHPRR
jgi:3-methyladenine DNA glycosylase AlkD